MRDPTDAATDGEALAPPMTVSLSYGSVPFISVLRLEIGLTMFYTSGSVKSSGRGIVASAARILGSSSGNSTVATAHIMP